MKKGSKKVNRAWLNDHLTDPYVKLAQKEGYRARAAYKWLQSNYSVEENPRMKDDGLYYYYHTMSKTLAVYGSKTLTDSAGRQRYWGVDLVNALASRQQADGSWKNQNARWQESNPVLATAYAV